ncbi:MAG: homocysteine S-methyltransferase family protein [Clostridia bacterium]|nr:homocysteine S-methyltransferase family protein [Clostridia bacterium]
MLTKEAFIRRFEDGVHLLDGATGTTLIAAGMPKGYCTELWILQHPDTLAALQSAYAAAGSEII